MKANWIPTNEYYHRVLDAPDTATREQLFVELFIRPWQAMMNMVAPQPGAEGNDMLAGARAWGWLLPDQTDTIANLLGRLEAADAWRVGDAALTEAIAHFAPYRDRIAFDQITGWLMLADPARAHSPEEGYTGATDWTQPRFVGQFWDPNEDNLRQLPGLIAHEMHHLIRLHAFPWDMHNTSVADYIVTEGAAESFATALFGADNVISMVSDLQGEDFETARRLIGAGLDKTGFNVIRGYIFGDDLAERWQFEPVGGMPKYGGYAIGYHVVQAFLQRTGRSIEETTFIPASQIVDESGFFA
ncbi:MAG: DUF2268 domain-containing putative Zn-dependent protease [Chloroflexota bacterium]